jgi:hypothetical protein
VGRGRVVRGIRIALGEAEAAVVTGVGAHTSALAPWGTCVECRSVEKVHTLGAGWNQPPGAHRSSSGLRGGYCSSSCRRRSNIRK